MHYMNQANAHNATQDTTMQDSATHDTATKATQDTAPLKGITVIDWTQVQSGPSCTQMLAWMGADVIKVEKVQGGDPTRNEMNDVDGSYSLYFLQLNANKKSITLNMRDPEGKKILAELLKKADVFVENIGPGDVEKLGFGWNDVHAINPRLIMASLKGFNKAAGSSMSRRSSRSRSPRAVPLPPPAGMTASAMCPRSPAPHWAIPTAECIC